MNWKSEWKKLAGIVVVFAVCFHLPVGATRFDNAVLEALQLVKWYAREHVLLCLLPAFFIASAIGVFVSQASVMKYLGGKSKQGSRLWGRFGVWNDSGGLLLHRPPPFRGHLSHGCGPRPSVCFPVFGTGHQCSGDCADGSDPRA